MIERFNNMGFKIKNFKALDYNLLNVENIDLFIGIYDDLNECTNLQFNRNDLGHIIIDEAHIILEENKFRTILNKLNKYNINNFKSIQMFSATLPIDKAEEIYLILKVKDEMIYNNLLDNYLNEKVLIKSLKPKILKTILTRF